MKKSEISWNAQDKGTDGIDILIQQLAITYYWGIVAATVIILVSTSSN